MTREEQEMSEQAFWEQFEPEPGIDEDGYYPGEKEYKLAHGISLDVSLGENNVSL